MAAKIHLKKWVVKDSNMTTLVQDPNLIFIHIPKNGGTSITKWLRSNLNGKKGLIVHGGMQHIDLDFKHATEYPTFAVVRNPWDRMVSTYEFKKTKTNLNLSFRDWLYSTPDESSNWFSFKTAQAAWLSTMPTWLLRFENLNEEFKAIQKYTNCFLPLPHKNATEHNKYTLYYTTETKKYVGRLFEEDIDLFKYRFEGE